MLLPSIWMVWWMINELTPACLFRCIVLPLYSHNVSMSEMGNVEDNEGVKGDI